MMKKSLRLVSIIFCAVAGFWPSGVLGLIRNDIVVTGVTQDPFYNRPEGQGNNFCFTLLDYKESHREVYQGFTAQFDISTCPGPNVVLDHRFHAHSAGLQCPIASSVSAQIGLIPKRPTSTGKFLHEFPTGTVVIGR